MSNIDKQALRLTAEKAKDNFMPNFMIPTRDVLALLDELEARKVTLPDVEKWRSPDAVRAQHAYRVLVEQALASAGIRINGEG